MRSYLPCLADLLYGWLLTGSCKWNTEAFQLHDYVVNSLSQRRKMVVASRRCQLPAFIAAWRFTKARFGETGGDAQDCDGNSNKVSQNSLLI